MKKIIILGIAVIIIIGTITIVSKTIGLVPETVNEGTAIEVPSDPIEFIKYSYGEDSQIFQCRVEEDFADYPGAYIEIILGVSPNNNLVNPTAHAMREDGVEFKTEMVTGAEEVEEYFRSTTPISLLPEDEYPQTTDIPYSDWEVCYNQMDIPEGVGSFSEGLNDDITR